MIIQQNPIEHSMSSIYINGICNWFTLHFKGQSYGFNEQFVSTYDQLKLGAFMK